MSKFRLPLTEASPAVAEFVKANKLTKLPTKSYAATLDHHHLYEAREATDHTDPKSQEAAFRCLAEITPRPSTKEVAFSLGFHAPKYVGMAANAWAASIGSDAHKKYPNRASSTVPKEKAVLPSALLAELGSLRTKKDILAAIEALVPQAPVVEVVEAKVTADVA